jgi:hypothetical protein
MHWIGSGEALSVRCAITSCMYNVRHSAKPEDSLLRTCRLLHLGLSWFFRTAFRTSESADGIVRQLCKAISGSCGSSVNREIESRIEIVRTTFDKPKINQVERFVCRDSSGRWRRCDDAGDDRTVKFTFRHQASACPRPCSSSVRSLSFAEPSSTFRPLTSRENDAHLESEQDESWNFTLIVSQTMSVVSVPDSISDIN